MRTARIRLDSPWQAMLTIDKLMRNKSILASNAKEMMNKVLRFPENCMDNLNELSIELTKYVIKEQE